MTEHTAIIDWTQKDVIEQWFAAHTAARLQNSAETLLCLIKLLLAARVKDKYIGDAVAELAHKLETTGSAIRLLAARGLPTQQYALPCISSRAPDTVVYQAKQNQLFVHLGGEQAWREQIKKDWKTEATHMNALSSAGLL